MSRPGAGRLVVGLGLLGAIGVAIRAGAAATAYIWFDEATMGLMGRDVLHGQFPFFLYGQSFMGAVDGYLHALSFAVLGESVATLRLLGVLVTLAHVPVAALLAQRVFRAGWWAVALTLVPSPYLMKWAGDARLVYSLLLVLTPLCLLLTLAAVDVDQSRSGRARAQIVLGLVGGLCWWINLLIVPVLVACALALVVQRPRVGGAAALAPLAFLLGSLPVWLFAGVYARLPIVSVALVPPKQIAHHLRDLLGNSLPRVVGVPDALVLARVTAIAAVAIVGLALVLALGDPRGDRAGRLLLGLATAVSLAAVLVTERGQALATEDPRYLLPILALLPVVLGGALGRVARWRPAWAVAAVAALVLAHAASDAKAYPALRSVDRWRASRAALARAAAVPDGLAARGLTEVYTHDPDVVSFTSGGRVTLSHFYLADDTVRAARVDAASRVAYLAPESVPAGFVESLAAAGIRYERESTPLGPLFTGFRLEPSGLREIPPAGWTATASVRPELASHAIDRDAGTRWRTTGRPEGAWLQVDLGRVRPVGMVTWLPGGYQEVPIGFRLDTSTGGVEWSVAREVPTYYGPLYWAAGHPMGRVRWGRVEARFPVRPARYVRLTHLGRDERFPWTVRELFVYEAGAPAAEPSVDARAAASALLAMGARHVYADHGEGPRLAEASGERLVALPDNVRVDRYGLVTPLERLPFLVPGPDAAVAYPATSPSGPSIEAALRDAGIGFTAADVGGYRLLGRLAPPGSPGRVARASPARVTAAPAGDDPSAATDGRVETRWSSRVPQAPGEWLQVELEAEAELGGLELDQGGAPLEYPRGLAVQVARDAGWENLAATVRWVGPLVWVGTHALRAGVERMVVTFPPIRVRGLRIVQTGRDAFHPWSVAELRLLAP
ncbi:MAG TPA: discoidin domain-containing protein [Methylomirabilota bacterium]